MATITGYLSDAGLAPFQGRFPELKFIPNRPATAGPNVVTREPVPAVITDVTGAFTVTVVGSDEMLPETTYTVTATWDVGRELDVFTDLWIPSTGGTLADVIAASAAVRPGTVMYGYGPPPGHLTNVLYIDISGVNPVLYAPSNGGI